MALMSQPRLTSDVRVPRLRFWRLERALTQEELAHRAGVSRATVARGEAGGSLRISSVAQLARALRVAPARLQHD